MFYVMLLPYTHVCMFFSVNVSFGVINYSVFEATGFVELILTKTPGTLVSVNVNVFTVDGTAG